MAPDILTFDAATFDAATFDAATFDTVTFDSAAQRPGPVHFSQMGELLATASVITIVFSGLALLAGVYFIRRGNREAHMRAMLTATALATVFLVFYLSKVAIGYTKVWVGPEGGRIWYLALLLTHTIMAALNVPLALVALWYALKGRAAAGSLGRIHEVPAASALFARHRAWVRWTVPVWLYVAVTGWIIYVVLEQFGAVKG